VTAETIARGKLQRVAGLVMSGLVIAFMLLDSGMKLAALDVVIQTTAALGYPASASFMRGLGLLLLLCTALYAWPRTAVLGAILLTGYLGGAIASHARIGSPLFTHVLFGVYIGMFAWGGLFLRDPRLRALLPWRAPFPLP
jgi:hypothetical protein